MRTASRVGLVCVFFGCLLLLVCPGVGRAEMITFYFSGIFTDVDNTHPDFDGIFSIGNTFAGSYSFESNQPNTGNDVMGAYSYENNSGKFSMQAVVNSNAGPMFFQSNSATGQSSVINVWDNASPWPDSSPQDRYSVVTENCVALGRVAGMSSYDFFGMMLSLVSAEYLDEISGTTLQTTPYDFTLLTGETTPFQIQAWYDEGPDYYTYMRGELNYFSSEPPAAVPLPGALALLGSGLAAIIPWRRMRSLPTR